MPDAPNPNYGHPVWHDLTIPEPETTRDFYSEVLGWTSSDVDMGGYSDYMMTAPDGTGVHRVDRAHPTRLGARPAQPDPGRARHHRRSLHPDLRARVVNFEYLGLWTCRPGVSCAGLCARVSA